MKSQIQTSYPPPEVAESAAGHFPAAPKPSEMGPSIVNVIDVDSFEFGLEGTPKPVILSLYMIQLFYHGTTWCKTA